jgi:hypothetical protein
MNENQSKVSALAQPKAPNPADRLEEVMRTLQQTRELGNIKNHMMALQELHKQIDSTQNFILQSYDKHQGIRQEDLKHLHALREGYLDSMARYYQELNKK